MKTEIDRPVRHRNGHMTGPNLFIIGAAKCGTSTLHAMLDRHPQVSMSKFKEPAFFLGPTNVKRALPRLSDAYRNNPDKYFALFENAMSPIAGESSTQYSMFPHECGVPERIHAFNSDARLIYIMRDPIERTISHYWWRVRWERETRDLLTAITHDPFYRDVSNYEMQLGRYTRLFSKEQIKVVTLEQLSARPDAVMDDILKWLSLDPAFLSRSAQVKENVGPSMTAQHVERPFLQWLRRSRLWDVVGKITPAAVRRFGRSLVEREVRRELLPVDRAIAYLRPLQLEQTRLLSKLVNREFPEWATLHGAFDNILYGAGEG